jgi:glycosyltransferase involved in cell wall biosynthesis
MTERPGERRLPFATIVLPIRNEARHIAACLEGILAQDYPHDRMEVLVMDGMSDDATRDIVARVAARHAAIAVRILDNPGQIVPHAINRALEHARGDIIVRIDGHCEIAPDYVRACVRTLEETGAECVGGPQVARGTSPFGEAVALATNHPFGVGGSRLHYATERTASDTVYMGTYRRDVFGWAGAYDETMACNEDDEFHYRLRARGGQVVLDPAIRATYHVNRESIRALWRQYYRFGLWKVRVAQKVPRQIRARHLIPFALVAGLAGGAVLSPMAAPLAWAWIALGSVYGAVNLAVSAALARRAGWRHLLRLPLVFFVLHASYGTGFAVGLVRFARHWRRGAPAWAPTRSCARSAPVTPGRSSTPA